MKRIACRLPALLAASWLASVSFPVAAAAQSGDSTLSLPLSAAMSLDDARDVIEAVCKVTDRHRVAAPAITGWRADGELRAAA